MTVDDDVTRFVLHCTEPAVLDKQSMHRPNSTFNPYKYCSISGLKLPITDEQRPYDPNLSVDNQFPWLIFLQIFDGLVQLLVDMTVLEFLCAQAPHSLVGFAH